MNLTNAYQITAEHAKNCADIEKSLLEKGECPSKFGLHNIYLCNEDSTVVVTKEECRRCMERAIKDLRRMNPRIAKYCKAYHWFLEDCIKTNDIGGIVPFDVYMRIVPDSQVDEMIRGYNL